MMRFIPGLQLSELFYNEIVKKILTADFSELKYSAGLIGAGSEVLGFDTEQSTDHDWEPRVMIFLKDKDLKLKKEISSSLTKKLPTIFHGYATSFGDPEKKEQAIIHRVEIFTIKSFF